jgi:putative membrane protein
MLIAGSALVMLSGVAQAQSTPRTPSNSSTVSSAPSTASQSALPAPRSTAPNETSPAAKPTTLERVDQYFIQKAAAGGAAEVDAAKLAQQKSSNSQVKEFAQTMIDDHTKANDQLKDIASKKGVAAEPDMTMADQEKQELNGLSGRAFDRKYAEMQVKDHEDTVKLFQDEAKSGGDSDLKQFASSTLPTLEHHMQMAKQLQAEVSGTASIAHTRHKSGSRSQEP